MTATRTPTIWFFVLAIVLALTYGSLRVSGHAQGAHPGFWTAERIAAYFDCHPDQVQIVQVDDEYEKHFCPLNNKISIGMVIAVLSGVVVTCFCGRAAWWRHR